jgi:hypothetical protein
MAKELFPQNAMNPGERHAKCMAACVSERAIKRWLDVKSLAQSVAQSVRSARACFLRSVLHPATPLQPIVFCCAAGL